MKINIVTGATGFVGKYLVKALLEKDECVWAIVRPLKNESVEKRTKQIFYEYISRWPKTFRVIEGDITVKGLGIEDLFINELKNNEVTFWHLAANLSFSIKKRVDVQKTNYIGTINVVKFANKIANKFVHMSTAYVCGNSTSFKEDELCKGQKPRNHYEESKIKAEKYVSDNCNIPFIIFRPSIIIGDAYQGRAEECTFGYYRYTFIFYFLKKQIIKTLRKDGVVAFCLKFFGTKYNKNDNILKVPWLVIPYPNNGRVNMVTVDFVIASMVKLYESNLHNTAVHLTHHNPPAHRLILHSIIYDVGFRGVKLAPIPAWMFKVIANIFYFLVFPVRKYIKSVMCYIPYITKECRFSRSIIERYGENPPEINRDLLGKINSYAKENILEHIKI